MASINKIRIGDDTYDIIPEVGKGLQFGTSLSNQNRLYVTLGTATASNGIVNDTGINVKEGNFTIDTAKFTTFLKALGFKTEQ